MKTISESEILAIDDLLGDTSDPHDSENVPAKKLAVWLGLTPNRLHVLAGQGVIPRNLDKTFPLQRAVRAYCEHARQGSHGRTANGPLADEKLRAARATADKLELANAKARGDMLDGREVAQAWHTIVTDLRAGMLAVPSRVAAKLGLDRTATAALDSEIRDAMEVIADDH